MHNHRAAPGQGKLGVQQTKLWTKPQFFEHRRHRLRHRHPLADGEQAVDSHPDKEHNKRSFELCREATCKHLRHASSSVFPLFSADP